MKNLRVGLNTFLLCIIFISLVGCQSSNLPTCESATNPFPKISRQADDTQYNPNIENGKVCSFTGEVERGQVYRRKIKDGLVFCLTPSNFWVENGGWTINIGDEIGNECTDNFAGVVTPPFHGNNAPSYKVGSLEMRQTPQTVKAVPHEKGISILFSTKVTLKQLFNSHYPDSAVDNSEIDLSKIPRSRGIFTITEFKLGNLIPNEVAWIETMKFEVKIYLPSD